MKVGFGRKSCLHTADIQRIPFVIICFTSEGKLEIYQFWGLGMDYLNAHTGWKNRLLKRVLSQKLPKVSSGNM